MLQKGGQIKSYWADCVFTSIVDEDDVITISTTHGIWATINRVEGYTTSFCLSNTYTDNPATLSYTTALPTAEDLNTFKYLYVKRYKQALPLPYVTYRTFELKNPYFKLDSDSGKIEAKDMVAEGGLFTNINADGGQFNNINVEFGEFENLKINNSLFKFSNFVNFIYNSASYNSLAEAGTVYFQSFVDTKLHSKLTEESNTIRFACNLKLMIDIYTNQTIDMITIVNCTQAILYTASNKVKFTIDSGFINYESSSEKRVEQLVSGELSFGNNYARVKLQGDTHSIDSDTDASSIREVEMKLWY